jgi:hypothetical protein
MTLFDPKTASRAEAKCFSEGCEIGVEAVMLEQDEGHDHASRVFAQRLMDEMEALNINERRALLAGVLAFLLEVISDPISV